MQLKKITWEKEENGENLEEDYKQSEKKIKSSKTNTKDLKNKPKYIKLENTGTLIYNPVEMEATITISNLTLMNSLSSNVKTGRNR